MSYYEALERLFMTVAAALTLVAGLGLVCALWKEVLR